MTTRDSIKFLAIAAIYFAVVVVLLDFKGGSGGERFTPGHKDVACAGCHTLVANVSEGFVGDFISNQNCTRCHTSLLEQTATIPLAFHRNKDRNCLDCHSFHSNRFLVAGDKAFEFNFENQTIRTLCATCHAPGSDLSSISDGHRSAAKIYHSDSRLLAGLSPSESCLLCHARGSGWMSDKTLDQMEVPRFSKHATHPLGITVPLGKNNGRNGIREELDPRIKLIGGKIECQTCHSLTQQNMKLQTGFTSEKEMCSGCHEHYER